MVKISNVDELGYYKFGGKEMTEYIYKGFKVHYEIKPVKKMNDAYHAHGSVICFINGDGPTLTQKFQTEGPSQAFVRDEIRKMINNYIDFEWDQFMEVQSQV